MLSPKQTRNGGDILQRPRKTYPSSDSGSPSCCRLCGLVQLGTLMFYFCVFRRLY